MDKAQKRERPKKTLVIGARSFIGQHFIRRYKHNRQDIFFTDHKSSNVSRRFDLLNPNFSLLPFNQDYSYGLIAAAIPNIAFCEQNPHMTYQSNVVTPLALGKVFCDNGITPIYFSSDYVFNGCKERFTENSSYSPVSEYGRQKVELEQRIPEVCGENYLIFRLSKVYGTTAGDGTLFDEMFQALLQGKTVQAASDQVFCPIDIDDVIEVLFRAQRVGLRGLFNLCGLEVWNRYELALQVAESLGLRANRIKEISLDDLNPDLIRSKYTAMSTEKLCQVLSFKTRSAIDAISALQKQYSREYVGEKIRE